MQILFNLFSIEHNTKVRSFNNQTGKRYCCNRVYFHHELLRRTPFLLMMRACVSAETHRLHAPSLPALQKQKQKVQLAQGRFTAEELRCPDETPDSSFGAVSNVLFYGNGFWSGCSYAPLVGRYTDHTS